jgi:hypothetical protein
MNHNGGSQPTLASRLGEEIKEEEEDLFIERYIDLVDPNDEVS